MWVLWAAYDLGSFPSLPKGWKREEFTKHAISTIARHSKCLVVEDDCKWFKEGRGPMCLIGILNFGWRIEPHIDWFMWASARKRLRGVVAFLQKVRWAPEVGVCIIRSLSKDKGFFIHLRKYGVCFMVGDVPGGDPRGDETLFYVGGGRKFADQREKEKKADVVETVELQAA